MCVVCFEFSRRALLVGGGAAVASMSIGAAEARVYPADMVPLVGPGYRPTESDEMGLWKEMDRVEEEVAESNLLITDSTITGYLRDLIGTVGGPAAKDFRIYLARVPEFNAMMFPTGFAVVFSGLLLRMRNEAQLAGVIAHGSGHFLRRHMIRSWRDRRRRPTSCRSPRWRRGQWRRRWRLSRQLCPACPARCDPVTVSVQPGDEARPMLWARSSLPKPDTRRWKWQTSGSS
jgi:hypothetical protein